MFVLNRDDASILHADLDSFYASVEQRDDPTLRGRPVLVGPGIVLAASYEAKAFGVKSAMNVRQARRLCPDAVVVNARIDAYTEASKRVFEVFDDTSPIVEGISIDEAFIDVAGLRRIAGEPVTIAARLRARVRDEVGLPITVGVARTKFLAKVASRVAKPDGLLVVPPDGETAFLHPLPVGMLWGIGPKTTAKLNDRGIFTVAEVAALDPALLTTILGKWGGPHIHALAHNRDPRPVEGGKRRRSIGSQHAMSGARRTAADIDAVVVGIVDRVSRRMRSAGRAGRTVVLRLRFDDFTRASRSHTLPRTTSHTETLLNAVRHLVGEAMPLIRDKGVTLIGISVSNLDDADSLQLSLPFDDHAGTELDSAVDAIRERFGSTSLRRAVLLGRRDHIAVPMLPD